MSVVSFKFNDVLFDVIVDNSDDVKNKSYFFGSKVASALGYKQQDAAVRRHCRKAVNLSRFGKAPTKRGGLEFQPYTAMIPESDVYRLIMRSKVKEAVEFQDFICETVLPTIREHGTFPAPQTISPKPFEQIGYDIGIHNERIKFFEGLRCDCEYKGNFHTVGSHCDCSHKNERQKARRETLAEANILKSGPHCEAGKKGGKKTWQKIKDMELENEKLTSLVNELMKDFLKFDL